MKGTRNYSNFVLLITALAIMVLAMSFFGTDLKAQMKKPKMVTVSGTIIDLTCASKGHAMMDNWYNAKNDDHMTPMGKKESCAVMCLKGGQPAALFSGNKITAVFSCNPRATLADYAAKRVEVQGFWAGDGKDVKAFVPMKIRSGSGTWQDVDCETMHQ
ncbi:hypothetical protein MYX78_13260 [Acidobacteria bacterium AH-259-G07]|nr:hypothetical protein [Acidobacteria bacterium AH-259-G07]